MPVLWQNQVGVWIASVLTQPNRRCPIPFPYTRPFNPMFTRMRTAYPVTRRGSPVFVHRAMHEALKSIEEMGIPDAEMWLLGRIEAFARSWKCRSTEEQYVPMLQTWLEGANYLCDDIEWEDPKRQKERDMATARDVALWKQDPHNPRWAIAAAKLTPEQAAKRRAEWERVGGTPGPWGVIHSLRVVG